MKRTIKDDIEDHGLEVSYDDTSDGVVLSSMAPVLSIMVLAPPTADFLAASIAALRDGTDAIKYCARCSKPLSIGEAGDVQTWVNAMWNNELRTNFDNALGFEFKVSDDQGDWGYDLPPAHMLNDEPVVCLTCVVQSTMKGGEPK